MFDKVPYTHIPQTQGNYDSMDDTPLNERLSQKVLTFGQVYLL
jgi:hypothetical protein